MDSQDHGKTSPSGHESHGVQVCHKCGWSFPNPHPSAKHRRAHKRICGTIEGYKLIDSEDHNFSVSDDDQASDEDQQTPSPKNENRGIKEIGSGGVGERSNRSEDELFSDAVTEFSDSGHVQGLKEHLEGGRQLDKNVEKIVEGDWGTSQLLKVDATSATMHPPSNTENTSQMHNPEVLERATNELGSTTTIQDIVSSCTIDSMVSSVADTRTEEVAVGLSSTNDLVHDLPPVKSETVPDVPKDYITANVGDNGTKLSMTCDEQETDVKGNKENNVDKILSDDVSVITSKTESEASKLPEMDRKTSDPVHADRIVESKEEQSEGSEPKMFEYDLSPEVESVEQMEAFVNTVQVEADFTQDIDVGSHGGLVEVFDTKGERNEDMHVLSVASEMPVIDRPEIMIEDFKDHRAVESSLPLTLGPGEVTRSLEDDTTDTVYEESHSKLPEMDGKSSDPVRADGIVESKEEQSEGSEPKMSDHDLSPEVESVEQMESFVNTVQVEADSAQDIDVGSHGGLVEVSDTKGERNEDMHMLSVANDMPAIDRPGIMIEDFKDHRAVESNLPLTLGPGEVIRSLEDDTKDTVYGESHSNLPEMDGKSSDPVRMDGIVESKEKQSEGPGSKMSECDLPPEVESVEPMEVFVSTVQVKADSAQDIDVGSHGGLVKISNTKGEESEDMHVLSVANDMPVIDRPDIMIEDFEDHRAVESNLPLSLGPGEVIRSLEDDSKDTVYGESHSNLPEMDGKSSDPVRVDGIVESKEKQSEGPGSKMSECDLPPEVESVEPMEFFVSTVQVKADSAQDIDVGSHGGLVKISNMKGEGSEDMHVLSVANDMPIIDLPEIVIEDFKDHKAMKLNLPLTLGPGEVIRSLEDDSKDTVYEESHSNSDSNKLCERINTSFADADSLDEDRGNKHVIEDVPVEGEADTSEFKVTSGEKLGSSGLEARLDTIMIETQKDEANYHLKGLEPHFGNDLQQNIPPEYNTKGLSDVIPIVTSVDDNIDHSTNLSGGDNVDNHVLDNIEKCDRAGNDSREGAAEDKISENEKMPSESADSLSVLEVDQITNILEHGDTGDREIAGIDFSDIAGNESTEAAGEKKCAVKTKATFESACRVTESQVVVDDGINKVVTNLQDNDTPYLDRVLESSQVIGTTDLGNVTQTHSSSRDCQDEDNNEVLAECAGTINMVAESSHDGDFELTKSSENFNLKKPGPLPVDCQFTVKNSATVEDSHCRDGGRGVSGFSSETLQEEGENLTKQPVGVSAVDISVDSSSQTDSLEGNWGSVSVLSTQSDALAAIDAEALQQSEKSNLEKPKTASDGHHANKSDVFEQPSFMTLVESGGGVDQKDTSEIQTVQNTQQPKSDALQAGWFPSLTNVVNESQGRKKNEEIIAKVTSWSTGKQHTPLKSLLGEANLETKPKSPNPKQSPTAIRKDEAAAVNNVTSATTGNSILGPKAPTNEAVKSDTGKEWNSPARYPIDNKKEKRKVKGKPYWVPFACCSSVN